MNASKNTSLSRLPRFELADIFREYGPAYLRKFGECMPPRHHTVMERIIACRTEVLGGKVFRCKPCNQERYSYHPRTGGVAIVQNVGMTKPRNGSTCKARYSYP